MIDEEVLKLISLAQTKSPAKDFLDLHRYYPELIPALLRIGARLQVTPS